MNSLCMPVVGYVQIVHLWVEHCLQLWIVVDMRPPAPKTVDEDAFLVRCRFPHFGYLALISRHFGGILKGCCGGTCFILGRRHRRFGDDLVHSNGIRCDPTFFASYFADCETALFWSQSLQLRVISAAWWLFGFARNKHVS